MLLLQRLRGFTDAHKGTYRSIPLIKLVTRELVT